MTLSLAALGRSLHKGSRVSFVGLAFGGKGETKACAARRIVGSPQAAAMRFNDGAADGQSHTGAMPLGGKESIEDLVRVLRRQPYPCIADRNHKVLVLRWLRLNCELAPPIHVLHGVDGIHDEI